MIKEKWIVLILLFNLPTCFAQIDLGKTLDETEIINYWKADSLFSAGEYGKALSYYELCNPRNHFDVAWPIKKGLCYLLNEDTVSAQNYIRKHIYNGGHYLTMNFLKQIPLLELLVPDQKVYDQFTENTYNVENSDSTCLYPEVKKILMEMREIDQSYRTGAGGDLTVTIVDSVNGLKLDSLINIYGWLGFHEVGKSGENASFLIAQHSDRNLPFQKKCLQLMTAELYRSNVTPQSVAMIYDRLKVNSNEPQIFGSQVRMNLDTNMLVLQPTYSLKLVNAYRSYFGMQSVESYVEFMNERNN